MNIYKYIYLIKIRIWDIRKEHKRKKNNSMENQKYKWLKLIDGLNKGKTVRKSLFIAEQEK